ncbi:MAG TPA: thioesterase family protein [Bryobacteraceae bacterium]|jgi:YbgC/YbaW family acyl-CoA thioester hydrolase|nr:thioesterase family protein [Bryobacteraceae bacterium]
MAQPFHFQTRIRFIDTDASGRIHYTAMFRYFESAEIEFMRTLDISYLKHDFALPRVHVECDFRLALEHDDLIDIELRVAKVGTSSIHFAFRTLKAGELAATGSIVVACMDRKTQRSAPLPDLLREKLRQASANHVN